MEAVIIRRAQAGKNNGAFRIPLRQGGIPKQRGKIETLAFHKNAADAVCPLPAHVAGVRRENSRLLPSGQRTRPGFQATVEKIVEMFKLSQPFEGLLHVDAVLLHKGGNAFGAGRPVLPPPH